MRRLGMPVSDMTILRSLKEHARARPITARSMWLALMTGRGGRVQTTARSSCADSDEAGHAFQYEAGHLFQSQAGQDSDLKPATQRSLPRIDTIMFRRGG